jgi:Pretoxin HINT domain
MNYVFHESSSGDSYIIDENINPDNTVQFINSDFKPLRYDRIGNIKKGNYFWFQDRLYKACEDNNSKTELFICNRGIVKRQITGVSKKSTKSVIDLAIEDNEGNESIICGTIEHPFFVPEKNDYVPMRDLKPGDKLRSDDGSIVTVKSGKSKSGDFTVYNIEVDVTHNYFVQSPDSESPVLVHNSCAKTDSSVWKGKKPIQRKNKVKRSFWEKETIL